MCSWWIFHALCAGAQLVDELDHDDAGLTETPKSARKPTAEETEKLVCVRNSASGPPMEAMTTLIRISMAHFEGAEHGVEDEKNGQHGDGNDDRHALVGALLALVFAGPLQVIAGGQLHVVLTLAMASSTVEPRSRPRTEYLMAM
jgi:ABC-type uncharacterized transport system ATPase component